MSTRAHMRRRLQRQPMADSDVATEHPLASFESASAAQTPSSPITPTLEGEERQGHDFGQIAVQAPEIPVTPEVQMKRRVSQPGDPHEQEADQVADEVTSLPNSATAESAWPAPTTHDSGSTDGQPLDTATRAFMEPRFGHDFGHVRVHADEQAAAAAESVGARAYTVGSDIVFGAQEYAPDTASGRHLLAHELTHVVQQQGDATAAATVQRDPAEATLPDTSTVVGKKVSPDRMNDNELAEGVLHKLHGILDAWKTALGNFYVVLASSSDKETRADFPKVMLDFLREEAVGEIIKYVPLEMGRAYKLLTSLGTEDKRAQAAQDSAKLRDFVVSHASAIGDLETAVENNWSDFVASVRLTAQAMSEGEQPATSGKKGKGKGKWGVEVGSPATKVFDDYWMMHMALMDTYSALDAQAGFATAANLFRLLSEEWIRGTMVKEGWAMRHARIIIHMNKDFSVKDAHIEGSGGQKIAEQLLKDAHNANMEGVDIYNMDVRKEIHYFGDESGYPSAYVYLDEQNHIHDAVRGDEGTAAVWAYIRSNGARALIAKKIDGD